MDNLLLYTSEETMLITLVRLLSCTTKDDFVLLVGKLIDPPNLRRPPVAMDIIHHLNL